MVLARKHLALLALLVGFVLLNPHLLQAVDEEHPIIARVHNDIYAVSPSDGSARLLVERDDEKDALISGTYGGSAITLFPISPDNTKFAYTTPLHEMLDPEFEDQQADIANLQPRDITIVDIASGSLTPITNQGPRLAELVESDTISTFDNLTWSVDGQRLYFLTTVKSLRNRVPQLMIEYYDLQTGEQQTLVTLNPQASIMGLHAVSEGLVVVDATVFEGDFKFTLYGPDGSEINALAMPLDGTMQCSNPTIYSRNPMFMQDDYYYGYYTLDLGPAALLDVASGESIPLEGSFVPAVISHTHRDTSLRVVGANLCSLMDGDAWIVTDAAGDFTSIELNYIEANDDLEIALSPDGQSIAYRKYETYTPLSLMAIMVATVDGTRELDFEATQILWGAVDFTFAQVNMGSGG